MVHVYLRFGNGKGADAEVDDVVFGSSYGHPIPIGLAGLAFVDDAGRALFVDGPVAEAAFMALRISHATAFDLIAHA